MCCVGRKYKFLVTIRGKYRNQELLKKENPENIGGREDTSAFLETPTYDIKLQKVVTVSAVRLFYTCCTLVLHFFYACN